MLVSFHHGFPRLSTILGSYKTVELEILKTCCIPGSNLNFSPQLTHLISRDIFKVGYSIFIDKKETERMIKYVICPIFHSVKWRFRRHVSFIYILMDK